MPGPDFLDLPTRATKPRGIGITHVLDRGIPLAQSADLLAMSESYVDVWKLGWGISYLDPTLPGKLELLARHGVLASPGGTLLEIAWAQGRAMEFLDWARGCGFPCVEVSAGTVPMEPGGQAGADRRGGPALHRAGRSGAEGPGSSADARAVGAGRCRATSRRVPPGCWPKAAPAARSASTTPPGGARGRGFRAGLGGRPGFPRLRGPAGAAAVVVRPPVRPRREPGQRGPGRCARAGDPPALAASRHLRGLVTWFAARA